MYTHVTSIDGCLLSFWRQNTDFICFSLLIIIFLFSLSLSLSQRLITGKKKKKRPTPLEGKRLSTLIVSPNKRNKQSTTGTAYRGAVDHHMPRLLVVLCSALSPQSLLPQLTPSESNPPHAADDYRHRDGWRVGYSACWNKELLDNWIEKGH